MKNKNKIENYRVTVRFRKDDGMAPIDVNGNKVNRISFDAEIILGSVEWVVKSYYNEFRAITAQDIHIDIELSIFNTISRTYMVMYSYYGSNGRFIKH